MESNNRKKIQIQPNGPYMVSGKIPLDQLSFVSNRNGASTRYDNLQTYATEETYFLCRCGKTQNYPFCDGAHYAGFDGTETASHKTYEEMAEHIEGKFIDLLDAESLCAVARFCDTKGGTWNLVSRGSMPEMKDIIIQQCNDCPSGRLTAVTKEGVRIEPELPQEISILEDPVEKVHGPIWVKGGIEIEDANGNIYPVRNRVTLCRCGKSKNKPFCDARHLEDNNESKE